MAEVEAKAARVDELEKKMANLELDKELMRKEMMAEIKVKMAQEKKKLVTLGKLPEKNIEEVKAEKFDFGSNSVVAGIGGGLLRSTTMAMQKQQKETDQTATQAGGSNFKKIFNLKMHRLTHMKPIG